MGLPSPAAASPLLVLRSTGPQPLVAERNGRALTAVSVLGGAGMPRVTRASEAVWDRPRWTKVAVAVTSDTAGSVPAGAVTCQPTVNGRPAVIRGAVVGVVATAVQPAGTVRPVLTMPAAGAPAATLTVADSATVCPLCT